MYVYVCTVPDAAVSRIAAGGCGDALSRLNPSNFVETHTISRAARKLSLSLSISISHSHGRQGRSIL